MLLRPSLSLAGLLLVAGPAPANPPDPLDARIATRALQHRSAFDGYRRHGDEPLVGWRQANDTAGRIGGWRTYAREAAAAATPASAPTPAPSAASAPVPARPMAPGHRH